MLLTSLKYMCKLNIFYFTKVTKIAEMIVFCQSVNDRKQTDLSVPRRCSSVMVKMACEREDAAFIAVEPTVRAEFPSSRQPTISTADNTCLSVNPTIWKKTKTTQIKLEEDSVYFTKIYNQCESSFTHDLIY